MINAIDLKSTVKNIYFFDDDCSNSILPNIKHINILVGENNSGKSRFCRMLLNNPEASILSDQMRDDTKIFVEIKANLTRYFSYINKYIPSISANCEHSNTTACELYIYLKKQINQDILKNNSFIDPTVIHNVNDELNKLYSYISRNNRGAERLLCQFPKVYIPILRGVECFNLYFDINTNNPLDSLPMNKSQREALNKYIKNSERIYRNKISEIYKIDPQYIFTGENLYNEIRDKLLGTEPDRRFIKEFEDFISLNFYGGESFSIIPIISKGYLYVKIGNNPERELHNLGDGIKQLICILYKIFEIRNKETLVFIEEPELNLHPGYQRRLLRILQDEQFSKLQFFVTTHSNHFVDSCFEYDNISIYRFEKIEKDVDRFRIINTSPKDIKILDMLGVNNSSVFMANSTIWIEGLSDKIYLNKYLQVYMRDKKLKRIYEGTDYSFVEYGGNNITHWTFEDECPIDSINASGITNRAFVIVDNDNDKKKERKKKLKVIFKNNYMELPVREIENTIKKEVLEKTLFVGEPVYKKMKDDLGYYTKDAFIWKYIDNRYIVDKKYWNSKSNQPNVKKVAFAKMICDHITTIDDLSQNAIKICDQLYKFISSVSYGIND